MSGLRVGDIILDTRRAIYIPTLSALVCGGLPSAGTLHDLLNDYAAEAVVVLGESNWTLVRKTLKAFGKKARFILVGDVDDRVLLRELEKELRDEKLHLEFHTELVWGGFRFVENALNEKHSDSRDQASIGGTMTIAAHSHDLLLDGAPAFLKGFGKVVLPSVGAVRVAVRRPLLAALAKYNVFAVSVKQVIPVGKLRWAQKMFEEKLAENLRSKKCPNPGSKKRPNSRKSSKTLEV